MADFTADTAQQAIEEKRHQDQYRGEAQWTTYLPRRPWDHIWRLQFPRHMSTAQAAEHLHNYLTGVLKAGNLGEVASKMRWAFAVERASRKDEVTARPCARGLTSRTRMLSVQDMRDRWKHGHSKVENIQDSQNAVSFVAEHLSRPGATPVVHLPE